MAKKKVGKNTPVWQRSIRGEVVCGATLAEAIGVSPLHPISAAWKQVTELPAEQRVVIKDGAVLPRNKVVEAIASAAITTGPLSVTAYGGIHTYQVTYIDAVKVIIA